MDLLESKANFTLLDNATSNSLRRYAEELVCEGWFSARKQGRHFYIRVFGAPRPRWMLEFGKHLNDPNIEAWKLSMFP